MKKVQRAHDLICNQVTYNDAFINGMMNEETAFSQSAYSVLCRKSTVCAGYALAFEMLCNGVGIDTVAVTSYDHAWNKVRLDDSWYNVDLTWDDTDQVIYYDFFVRSDAFYDSVIQAESHAEESVWYGLLPRCTLDSNPSGSIVPGSMTLGSTVPGNLPVITGQTEEPLISISQDNFVTLSCAEANADIYYSLDGSSPMPSFSKCYKYQGPFQIEGKVKVQAAAVCDTYKDSGVVSSDERDIPIIRKIFFNGNGAASGKMETIERYKVGESGALPANTYKRTGYVYIGWNTRADGSGTPYEDGLPVMSFRRPVTTSVTLYAQWDPIRYTITYHLNGGKNSSWNPAAYYVTDAVVLYNPTRKGYTFQGWYQDSSYKVRVEGIKAGSIGNKTLYAKWTPNKYSIVFKGNKNTSGKMSALKSRTYDVSYRLSANKFKRKGYTFTGWNTKSNGKGKKYSNKQKIKNLTSAAQGKVTLYAQWKKKKYTITYKLKGGKNSRKNPTAYYYTTRTVKLKNPTRKGYTFKGWYADKKYKKKVTQIKKGTTGNKILYAKWKRK